MASVVEWRSFAPPGALRPGTIISTTASAKAALRATARRWLALHEEIAQHDRELDAPVSVTAPQLTAEQGFVKVAAAELLLLAGDNPERIRSEGAFATLCEACSIPAFSGRTTRHRLNRGGNRQTNAALHCIVVIRMRGHEPTIDYVAHGMKEARTKPAVMHCLKRYVAREVFALVGPRSKAGPRPP